MSGVSIRETLLVLAGLAGAGLVTVLVLANDGAPPTRWRTDLAAPATAGPALAGGRVFAGSEAGVAFALDAATGVVAWRLDLNATPRGAILADARHVYMRTDEGDVIALDAATGAERWRARPPGGVNPPLLAGDAIVIASRSGTVTAVDAATGETRWTTDTGRTIRATPALVGEGEAAIAVGDIGGRLLTLDRATGALLSERTVGGEFAGPVLHAGDLLIAGPRAAVIALDADGVERWRTETGQPTRLPMIARDGVVYVDASPDVLALDFASGAVRWRYSSRALAVTFGVGEGLVVAGMHQGEVHGIDMATGERRWRYRTNESVRGTPVIDEASGIAYFAGLDGFVYAIALRDDEPDGESQPG